jgi:hypothetical protein
MPDRDSIGSTCRTPSTTYRHMTQHSFTNFSEFLIDSRVQNEEKGNRRNLPVQSVSTRLHFTCLSALDARSFAVEF